MTGHVYFDYTEDEKGTHGACEIELYHICYTDKVKLMTQLIKGLQMDSVELMTVVIDAIEEAHIAPFDKEDTSNEG